METQEKVILNHLKRYGSITNWDAIMQYGITRNPEMIRRLKKRGYEIESKRITKKRGNRTVYYVEYVLKKGDQK